MKKIGSIHIKREDGSWLFVANYDLENKAEFDQYTKDGERHGAWMADGTIGDGRWRWLQANNPNWRNTENIFGT